MVVSDKKIFSIGQIFPLIGEANGANNIIDGYHLSLNTFNLLLFKKLGRTCCICGLNGIFFAINKEQSKFRKNKIKKSTRLTLWGIDNRDRKIKMTVDHIMPKSRYPELKNNFCVMCKDCNNHKRDLPMNEFLNTNYVKNKLQQKVSYI